MILGLIILKTNVWFYVTFNMKYHILSQIFFKKLSVHLLLGCWIFLIAHNNYGAANPLYWSNSSLSYWSITYLICESSCERKRCLHSIQQCGWIPTRGFCWHITWNHLQGHQCKLPCPSRFVPIFFEKTDLQVRQINLSHNQARTYLQLPLRQWGAGNVYFLVLSSWKVNIAENPIAVMGL